MSKVHYNKAGNITTVSHADTIADVLPVGIYSVAFSMNMGFYLNNRTTLDVPKKIYGGSAFPERILKTFNNLGRGMSVLLSGPKGTGKTVDAKRVCMMSGLPVIIIPEGYEGAGFSQFIENINTPCVFLIDEFEKIYHNESHRNFFLSVMDGVGSSRHLFVLTSNEPYIGEFFISRPGRVRYHKKYDFLGEDIIEEIIRDKLINHDRIEDVKTQLLPMPSLSVDVLTCIIDECNLHDEIPSDFMSFFNVSAERPKNYEVVLKLKRAYAKPELTAALVVAEKAYNEASALREKASKNSDDDEYVELPEEKIYTEASNTVSRANSLAYNFNVHHQISDDLNNLCEVRELELKSSYATPFQRSTIGKIPHIDCSIFDRSGEKYEEHQISWHPNHITSFEETRKGFVARHRTGSVLMGKPAKSYA